MKKVKVKPGAEAGLFKSILDPNLTGGGSSDLNLAVGAVVGSLASPPFLNPDLKATGQDEQLVKHIHPLVAGLSFTFSDKTIATIQYAITNGPGANNINYQNAYNAINSNLQAQNYLSGGTGNTGSLNWFSQAAQVNAQGFSPNPTGTWIWAYTEGAAATQGYNVTNADLGSATNAIAAAVFKGFQTSGWIYSDGINGNASPTAIVANDAGAGFQNLNIKFPGINNNLADWGGTLFATNQLNDPTFFSDYGIQLTPGSAACNAIIAGTNAGFNAVWNNLNIGWTPALLSTMSSFNQGLAIYNACKQIQSSGDGGYQLGQAADNNLNGGFTQKYAAWDQALGDLLYSPSNTSQITSALSQATSDFGGYHLVTQGDTWNSVAQSYGLTGSQLADLNNTFASGAAPISTSVIVVPSNSSTISSGGSFSVPIATSNDYGFDTSDNTYQVVGTAFKDANQGQFSVFNAAGQVTDIASGLTQNVTANVGGTTVNLGSAGDLYSATFGSTVFGSISTNGGQVSLLDPGLSSISGSSGVLGFLNGVGAGASLGENSTGSTATIAGSNLTADFNTASASVVDDAQGLLIADSNGVTGGKLTFGLSGLSLTDDGSSLLFKDGSGVTGGSITLGASNLALTDAGTGLSVLDGSGVTGGNLTLGASNLGLTDDAAGLRIGDGSGVTGGSVTLGASNLSLTDAGTGLSVLDGSGVTGGNLTLGASNLGLTDDAAGLKIGDGSGFTGGSITLGASNLALTDAGTGLSILDGSGVTGGNLTLGASNLGLTDDAAGLRIGDGSGVTGGSVTLGASNLALTDAGTGLSVLDGSGVTGGNLTLGASNLSLTDDAAGLRIGDGSGFTGGSITLGASNLALTDAGTGLSVLDGSGVTGGNLTLGASNLGLTDDAAGLVISDGSGDTGGNVTLGGNGLKVTDNAAGLTFSDGSGDSGGVVTLGSLTQGFTDDAAGLFVNDASGVSGGAITLGANNLGLTDDAAGLVISDGSGISGGNVTLGGNGLKLTDNAAGLTFSDGSGDSGGVVTLGSLTQGFTDDAAGLFVNDASGVSGGAITLGANNLGLTDDAAGLTVSDGSGISGGNVTLGGNGLKLTDNAAGLTFSDGSGDSGGVVTLGSLTHGFTDDAAGLTVNDASGVSGGAITLGVNGLGLTDDAAGLTIGDGSGISGGNVTLGGNGLKLTDNAAGLTFSDGSGDSGGVVTLGSLTQGFTDDAAGLTVNDASGVSGGAITLGANGLGLTDDAAGLTVSDGSGISGGNVTLGGNGLKLTDNAAGLTFSDGSGDSGGVVTLGSLTHGFTDDAAGLTVNDASGVTGGTVTLSAANLTLTNDGSGTTIDTSYADTVDFGVNWSGTLNGTANDVVDLLGGNTFSSSTSSLTVDLNNATNSLTFSNGSLDLENSSAGANIIGSNDQAFSNSALSTTALQFTGTGDAAYWDNTANNSNVAEYFAPQSGVTTEFEDLTGGLNGYGTNNVDYFNLTGGGSQEQVYTGLASGTSEQADFYTGIYNGAETGALTQQDSLFTSGSSEAEFFNVGDGVSDQWQYYNASDTNTENFFDLTAGGSQEQQFTGLANGVSESYSDYSGTYNGSVESGTVLDKTNDFTAGNSQTDIFDPNTDVNEVIENWSGTDDSGLLNTSTVDLSSADSSDKININFDYSGSTLTGYVENLYNSSGAYLGDADYNASGGYTGGSFDGGLDGSTGYGGYGGYGAYGFVAGAKTKGTNIGVIAQYDLTTAHNQDAAQAAEAARAQAISSEQTSLGTDAGAATPRFEPAKWGSKTITWSLADSPGTSANPFSSYMTTQYEAAVEKAFATWAAASGLTFVQVADSSQSDIRIGWGDFDTGTTGVAGYTNYREKSGWFQAGVTIRLEDPNQDALTLNASGQLTYAETQTTLSELLLHEIGHALGLADNSDPNSVLNAALGLSNQSLDQTDITGISDLYNSPVNSALVGTFKDANAGATASTQRLIQAMAAFGNDNNESTETGVANSPWHSVLQNLAVAHHT